MVELAQVDPLPTLKESWKLFCPDDPTPSGPVESSFGRALPENDRARITARTATTIAAMARLRAFRMAPPGYGEAPRGYAPEGSTGRGFRPPPDRMRGCLAR